MLVPVRLNALVADLLALVHQAVHGVVLPFNLFFASIRVTYRIALRFCFLRVRNRIHR